MKHGVENTENSYSNISDTEYSNPVSFRTNCTNS